MALQRKKISEAEHERLLELLERGFSPRQIAATLRRSANCIYSHLKAKGIKLTDKHRYYPSKAPELSEEIDYSKLSDDFLFNPKHFPAF